MIEYDMVIGTTAVNRSELHVQSFSSYVKFIGNAKVKWIIHINKVYEESVDDTIKTIVDLCEGRDIDLEFFVRDAGGSVEYFYEAVRVVCNEMLKHTTSYGYLWLEDDWEHRGDLDVESLIKEFPLEGSSYLQVAQRLNRDVQVSFNPGVWSPSFFESHFVKRINNPNPKQKNPEKTVIPRDEERALNRLANPLYHKPMFYDIGRPWQQQKNIHRTFQPKR